LGLVGVGTGLVIKTHRGEHIVLKLHKSVEQVGRDPQRRGDLGAIGTCEDVLQLELIWRGSSNQVGGDLQSMEFPLVGQIVGPIFVSREVRGLKMVLLIEYRGQPEIALRITGDEVEKSALLFA